MAAMRMKRMRMIRKMTTLRFMIAVCGGGSVELFGEVVCVKILGKVSIPISNSIPVDGCVSEKNVPEARVVVVVVDVQALSSKQP